MLHLDLHIQPQTEQRLKKILAYASDEETFAQEIIAYQVAELHKGSLNIRLDLKHFEEKYQQSTEEFYRKFEQGLVDDSEDATLWAGLYEVLQDNERRLQDLSRSTTARLYASSRHSTVPPPHLPPNYERKFLPKYVSL